MDKVIRFFKNDWFIFLFCMLFGGWISWYFGPAIYEYDVYNYHIYAPWAFLNNRIGVDVIPAGIRSYFNPMMDIPYYLMVKYLNNYPEIVTFIQGFYYGGVLFLGYKLSALLRFRGSATGQVFRFISLFLIASAPVILYEIGTLYNDLTVAIFILWGMYIYLGKVCFEPDSRKRNYWTLFGAFLLGAVSGLKLTCIIMVLGIVASILFMFKSQEKTLKIIGYSAIGFVIGFLIFNGYWYYLIWKTFGNPVFPYFNNIFHSPYGQDALIINDSYTRVMPESFLDKIFHPFVGIIYAGWRSFGSWIFSYTDARPPLGAIAFVYLMLVIIINKLKGYKSVIFAYNDKIVFAMLIFTGVTYTLWINIFPIVRYIIPVIVVACILINYFVFYLSSYIVDIAKNEKSCVRKIFINSEKSFENYFYIFLIIIISGFIYKYSKVSDWSFFNLRKGYYNSIFPVTKSIEIKDNSLVLLGSQQTSFVIPQLNKNAVYHMLIVPMEVDISHSNQSYNIRTIDFYYSPYYEKQLHKMVKEYKDIYLIYIGNNSSSENKIIFDSIKIYAGESLTPYNCRSYQWLSICKIK